MQAFDVVVVGGGAIGATVARRLALDGNDVCLLDREEAGRAECSAASAGLLCPSHAGPLANPRTLRELPRLLVAQRGAVAISPSASIGRWLVQFLAACREAQSDHTESIVRRLCALSLELHAALPGEGIQTGFERTGIVSLFRTGERLGAARSRLPSYRTDGLTADVLSTAETADIGVPIGRGSIAGGIRYSREARCDPDLYLKEMVRAAARAGVAIHARTNVRRLQARSGRITAVETSESSYRAGTVVVAAGAWSSRLTEAIGLTLPIAPARGDWWDFGLTPEWAGSSPLFLEEDRVAITPLQDRVRVTSGFRLGSLRRYDPRRRQPFPRLPRTSTLSQLVRTPPLAAATGLRPCTPDGLPIVGRTARANNLIVASGHGTLGLTLAPVTSVLVAAILRDVAEDELQPLSPDRWSDASAVSNSLRSESPTSSLGG